MPTQSAVPHERRERPLELADGGPVDVRVGLEQLRDVAQDRVREVLVARAQVDERDALPGDDAHTPTTRGESPSGCSWPRISST